MCESTLHWQWTLHLWQALFTVCHETVSRLHPWPCCFFIIFFLFSFCLLFSFFFSFHFFVFFSLGNWIWRRRLCTSAPTNHISLHSRPEITGVRRGMLSSIWSKVSWYHCLQLPLHRIVSSFGFSGIYCSGTPKVSFWLAEKLADWTAVLFELKWIPWHYYSFLT